VLTRFEVRVKKWVEPIQALMVPNGCSDPVPAKECPGLRQNLVDISAGTPDEPSDVCAHVIRWSKATELVPAYPAIWRRSWGGACFDRWLGRTFLCRHLGSPFWLGSEIAVSAVLLVIAEPQPCRVGALVV
jgi:hypothetical protein